MWFLLMTPVDLDKTVIVWEDDYVSLLSLFRMKVEPLLDGCSYCRVTEDDIQASLRNIFHYCFVGSWVLGNGGLVTQTNY